MTDAERIEAMAQDFVCGMEAMVRLCEARKRGKWNEADQAVLIDLKRKLARLLVRLSLPFVPSTPDPLAKSTE